MKSLSVLWRKEWLELLRSGRLLWIPVVFIALGAMQPLVFYYMPEILKASGDVPPELLAGYLTPPPPAVMAQALGQYGTIGMLVLALGAMNAIAGERTGGVLELVLARPVSAGAVVLAKWLAQLFTLAAGLGLGASAAGYYTVQLIGPLSWNASLGAAALYGLWLLCPVSLTLLFGSRLRAPAAAALALLGAAALSLLDSLLPERLGLLPGALPRLSGLMLTEAGGTAAADWAGPALTACLLIVLCLLGAARNLGVRRLPD